MRLKGNVELYVDLEQFNLLKELANIASDKALYIDFQIAEASQKAGKLVSLIEEQLKDGHSFAHNIKGSNPRPLKGKSLESRIQTIQAWFDYILDDVKRNRLIESGFFKDGQFIESSLFCEPPALALFNSLKDSFFLEQTPFGKRGLALSWFKVPENYNNQIKYQSIFPIPENDFYWTSSSVFLNNVVDCINQGGSRPRIPIMLDILEKGSEEFSDDYYGNGYLLLRDKAGKTRSTGENQYAFEGGVFMMHKESTITYPHFYDDEVYPRRLKVKVLERIKLKESEWSSLYEELRDRESVNKSSEALRQILSYFDTTVEF